jgi:hypothetical protein
MGVRNFEPAHKFVLRMKNHRQTLSSSKDPYVFLNFEDRYTDEVGRVLNPSSPEYFARMKLIDKVLNDPDDIIVERILSFAELIDLIRNFANTNDNQTGHLVGMLETLLIMLEIIELYKTGMNKLNVPFESEAESTQRGILYYGAFKELLDSRDKKYLLFNNMRFYQYLYDYVKKNGQTMSPEDKEIILKVASLFEKTYSGYGEITRRTIGSYFTKGGKKTKRRRMKGKTSKNKRRKTSKSKR